MYETMFGDGSSMLHMFCRCYLKILVKDVKIDDQHGSEAPLLVGSEVREGGDHGEASRSNRSSAKKS